MLTSVQNLSDVERFARELLADGTIFHPDDDFSEYVTPGTDKTAFSKEEADRQNQLMDQCFDVCTKEGIDIYDFMMEISLIETGMDKYIPLPSEEK